MNDVPPWWVRHAQARAALGVTEGLPDLWAAYHRQIGVGPHSAHPPALWAMGPYGGTPYGRFGEVSSRAFKATIFNDAGGAVTVWGTGGMGTAQTLSWAQKTLTDFARKNNYPGTYTYVLVDAWVKPNPELVRGTLASLYAAFPAPVAPPPSATGDPNRPQFRVVLLTEDRTKIHSDDYPAVGTTMDQARALLVQRNQQVGSNDPLNGYTIYLHDPNGRYQDAQVEQGIVQNIMNPPPFALGDVQNAVAAAYPQKDHMTVITMAGALWQVYQERKDVQAAVRTAPALVKWAQDYGFAEAGLRLADFAPDPSWRPYINQGFVPPWFLTYTPPGGQRQTISGPHNDLDATAKAGSEWLRQHFAAGDMPVGTVVQVVDTKGRVVSDVGAIPIRQYLDYRAIADAFSARGYAPDLYNSVYNDHYRVNLHDLWSLKTGSAVVDYFEAHPAEFVMLPLTAIVQPGPIPPVATVGTYDSPTAAIAAINAWAASHQIKEPNGQGTVLAKDGKMVALINIPPHEGVPWVQATTPTAATERAAAVDASTYAVPIAVGATVAAVGVVAYVATRKKGRGVRTNPRSGRSSGGFWTRKTGPLPNWGWAGLGAVILGGVAAWLYGAHKRKEESAKDEFNPTKWYPGKYVMDFVVDPGHLFHGQGAVQLLCATPDGRTLMSAPMHPAMAGQEAARFGSMGWRVWTRRVG